MASDSLLRNRFALTFFVLAMVVQLPQLIPFQRLLDLVIGQIHEPLGESFQTGQLVVVDIAAFVLGKAVEEHASLQRAIRDERAIPARAPSSRPRHALLDHAPAQVSIDRPTLRLLDGLRELPVSDPLFPREAREPLRRENTQGCPSKP